MESLREIFFKTDRSTQKLTTGRSHSSMFDVHWFVFRLKLACFWASGSAHMNLHIVGTANRRMLESGIALGFRSLFGGSIDIRHLSCCSFFLNLTGRLPAAARIVVPPHRSYSVFTSVLVSLNTRFPTLRNYLPKIWVIFFTNPGFYHQLHYL